MINIYVNTEHINLMSIVRHFFTLTLLLNELYHIKCNLNQKREKI